MSRKLSEFGSKRSSTKCGGRARFAARRFSVARRAASASSHLRRIAGRMSTFRRCPVSGSCNSRSPHFGGSVSMESIRTTGNTSCNASELKTRSTTAGGHRKSDMSKTSFRAAPGICEDFVKFSAADPAGTFALSRSTTSNAARCDRVAFRKSVSPGSPPPAMSQKRSPIRVTEKASAEQISHAISKRSTAPTKPIDAERSTIA